jgi:hypothetical protein
MARVEEIFSVFDRRSAVEWIYSSGEGMAEVTEGAEALLGVLDLYNEDEKKSGDCETVENNDKESEDWETTEDKEGGEEYLDFMDVSETDLENAHEDTTLGVFIDSESEQAGDEEKDAAASSTVDEDDYGNTDYAGDFGEDTDDEDAQEHPPPTATSNICSPSILRRTTTQGRGRPRKAEENLLRPRKQPKMFPCPEDGCDFSAPKYHGLRAHKAKTHEQGRAI